MLPGKKYTPFDFATIAWKHRWVILLTTVLGIYAALVVSSRIRDIYQSEMLIQVVPQRVPDEYVKSTVTIRTEERLNALSQQVMSRTELERLIGEMDLYSEERARLPMEDIVERMRNNIGKEVVRSQRDLRDADAFYVRFTYPDKMIATRVTERLGALFIEVNARDRGDLAQATNNFLETQLADARRSLEAQERRLELFRERNAGRLPTQLQFNMQAIQNAQTEVQTVVDSLARDRDRKLMLERLYNDAQTAPLPAPPPTPVSPTGQPGDPNAPGGATAQQQLTAARELLARLELSRKPEHPDIVRTKRQIRDLEEKVAQQAAANPSGTTPPTENLTQDQVARRDRLQQMRAEIESLQRQVQFKESQEQRLRGAIADFQRRIEQVPGVESEWLSLSRDYDTQQAAYKDMLTKSEQSKVAAELEKRQIGEQFRVLDPARVPIRPIGIARLQVNAAGTAIGLVLGLLIAALMELSDSTLHTASDVADVLKLPVIALVPGVLGAGDIRRQRRNRLMVSAAVTVAVLVGGYGFWALKLWKHVA